MHNAEKDFYDFKLPLVFAVAIFGCLFFVFPNIQLFGEVGLIRFVRDTLIMAVPFMVGSLAAVAMGAPGQHLDRRPIGVELFLDGRLLTLRQFVSYLLGYLCFLALVTLGLAISAPLISGTVIHWISFSASLRVLVHALGVGVLSLLLSTLSVTVLWSLYFLTDVVNRPSNE